jgi:EmrB/QacA subfamily drug resistance transporter
MTPADSPRAKWLALGLLAAAQFVVVLDASIVNVALPSIGRDLDFSQDNLSWVVNAYTLFFGGFLLLGGRLADRLGRRRMFIAGMILFALASLGGGLANSELQLIIARAVQGLGAALVSPAALSIVTTTFAEGAERNKALGVWGAVAGSGGAAGVLLGGVLTEYAGWEWVLFVNVPIGLLAAFLAPRILMESRDTRAKNFDVVGAISVTAGLALLVYTLVNANQAGWNSGETIGLGVAAIVLLAFFVAWELRTDHPLVPFSVFRSRTLRGSNAAGLLIAASLFAMFYFISLYLQQVLRYSAMEAGLAYLPLAVSIILSAGIASVVVTRIGFKTTLMIGLAFVTVALLWFSQISAPGGSYVSDVLFPSIIAAIGLGFSFVPVTIGAVMGVSNDDSGLASGLINTSQQVGGALGLALLVAVANGTTGDAVGDPVALTAGFSDAFKVGAGFAFLGLILSGLLISGRDSREHAEAARRGEAAPAVV